MDYENLLFNLTKFKNLNVESIGRTWDDRDIFSISAFFNASRDWVIIHGGMHAREHLSSDFVVYLALCVENNFSLFKSNLNFPNICFIPMVNPDGIEICFKGTNAISNKRLKKDLKMIINNHNYYFYKANARGVDLNNNFDALWEKHKGNNIPSSSGYKGEYPFSERESIALASLTMTLKPIITFSFHTKGEEIYYDFHQKGLFRKYSKKIAKLISKINGYEIKSTQNVSFGGYKDWCINKLNIHALTIELGRDEYSHPVKNSEIYEIISKNSGILYKLCDIVRLCKKSI